MDGVETREAEPPSRVFGNLKTFAAMGVILLATFLLRRCVLPETGPAGAWCVLPAVLTVVWTFATKRVIEALTFGTVTGFVLSSPVGANVVTTYSDSLLKAVMSKDVAWLVIVCGLMGGIIALIDAAGGAQAFCRWAAKHARGERSALVWAWVLGCVIFIDDYLNSLTIGSCMAPLTDRHRTPREMLAYVTDSTAAPLCVLIPVTTWAAFAGRILVKSGWREGDASEIEMFVKTIPYNLYGWIAALIVPLVIFGIVPKIGAMRAAYRRVEAGGPLAPEGSERISMLPSDHGQEAKEARRPRMVNFLLPIAVLVGATVWFDTEMEMGVLVTLPVMFVLYLAQGVMTAGEFWDGVVRGIGNLVMPLLLMVAAFVFADMNERIGFTAWCIEAGKVHMTAATAPMFIFVILAATEFITGTNWGMYVIALPIVIPLARDLGVHMPLAVAACLSAGVFGSHISFCSDATVISSAACGCDNYRHALSQLPYGLISAALTLLGFGVLGFAMA